MPWVDNERLRQILEKNGEIAACKLKNAKISPHLVNLDEGTFDKDAKEDLIDVDLLIERGHIKKIFRPSPGNTNRMDEKSSSCLNLDLGGRIIMPTFVDCHTHLDKGHIIERTPGADGSFASAIATIERDKAQYWHGDDLRKRMDFALRCAYHHGTKALRTHLDTRSVNDDIAWSVFAELRQEWQGRIMLQAAGLMDIVMARDTHVLEEIARFIAKAGGVLGAFVYMSDDIDILLARLFNIADRYDLDLDFHADETLDPTSHLLLKIAETCLKNGYGGRILVGHCCAISQQPFDIIDKTLSLVARAGLNIVSLPLCNLYLQDRRHDGTTPRQRGVTLLHEMKALSIDVALGSDNVRDPFYSYGDLDMFEVYRVGTRILHLDHPVADWPCSVNKSPSMMMGLQATSLAAGQCADLIIFEGRTWSELLSRAQHNRLVMRNGQLIKTQLPSYCELDLP